MYKKYVFYGKGGIGKTNIAVNTGIAFVKRNKVTSLIGCSPKSNIGDLFKENQIGLPILDLHRKEGVNEKNIMESSSSYDGLLILEMGGPEPGVGCAGRGIPVALDLIEQYKDVFPNYSNSENVIYDMIGDIVCGGFATPMRGKDIDVRVIIVVSGELMALYSGNNIALAAKGLKDSGTSNVSIAGIVANLRGIDREEEIIEEFSKRVNIPILVTIPRDPETFRKAEQIGKPIVDAFPDSEITKRFFTLVDKLETNGVVKPTPYEDYNGLFDMFMTFQKGVHAKDKEVIDVIGYKKLIPPEINKKREKPLRISIYGTGGIGKSTVSSNMSAALVLKGEKVLQVGCDPKRDSISTICGELKPTIMDAVREKPVMSFEEMKGCIYEAIDYEGRLYGCECGGPNPGKGCAGKGVNLVLVQLEKLKMYERMGFTFVLYDVLGDTVCGGFALPLQFADCTYIVTSGESAPLVQSMKIIQSVANFSKRNPHMNIGVSGIINNMRGIKNEEKIVEEIFSLVGVPVIAHIPRSEYVQRAENIKRTVVYAYPESSQAQVYMKLSENIINNDKKYLLKSEILTAREVKEITAKYS